VKVKDAVFVKSAVSPRDYPHQGLPEVAFAGRSNVGKSSLINRLVHRKGLAKTSSTPGKTRLLNFFVVDSTLSLVDLPGYGFARVPEKVRRRWGPMVEAYLKSRKELRLMVLILDARRQPTGQDLQLVEWLRLHSIPFVAVVTKIDKIPRSTWNCQFKKIQSSMGGYQGRMIAFSAATGEGKAALWQEILRACLGVSADAKESGFPNSGNAPRKTPGQAGIADRKNDEPSPRR
jgi:GTP-binding protein